MAMEEIVNVNEKNVRRKNIWRLVLIQLLQKKRVLLAGLIVAFAALFVDLYGVLANYFSADLFVYYLNMNTFQNISTFVLLFIFIFSSYNFVAQEEISMYPGTKDTRVFSSLLFDHIVLICFILLRGVLYLFGCGILQILHRFLEGFDVSMSFSAAYLFGGMIKILCTVLLVYGICKVIFALFGSFDNKAVSAVIVVILVLGFLLRYQRIFDMDKIISFFFASDISLIDLIWRNLLGWAFCMVITLVITHFAPKRRRVTQFTLIFTLAVFYVTYVFVGIRNGLSVVSHFEHNVPLYSEVGRNYLFDYTSDEELCHLIEEVYENGIQNADIHEEGSDNEALYLSDSEVVTVSDAVRKGYIKKEEALKQNGFFLRVVAPEVKYQGKYIYQLLLEQLDFVKSDEIQYRKKKGVSVFNTSMGDAYYQTGELSNRYLFDFDESVSYLDGLDLGAVFIIPDDKMEVWTKYNEGENG